MSLDLSTLAIPAMVAAVAVFGLLLVLMGLRSNNNPEMDSRLSQFAGRPRAEAGASGAQALTQRLEAVVTRGKRGGDLARDLARADLKLKVTEFYALKIGAALLGVLFGAIVGRASPLALLLSALVGGLILSFAPNVYVGLRVRQRIGAFNSQLGDTITLLANSVRSGYSLLQSMDLVSREAPAPISSEFRRVVQEVGLGLSTEEALANLLRRVPSDDLELMVTAINIQMEVGGNLAHILDTIGLTIRERVRIKGEIMTLTAQGRISAWVITLLPIGLAIFISVINPSYMAPILSLGMPPEHWCCLPVTSLAMIAIGFVIIMRIVDIEV